jgi:hypothetical protein
MLCTYLLLNQSCRTLMAFCWKMRGCPPPLSLSLSLLWCYVFVRSQPLIMYPTAEAQRGRTLPHLDIRNAV